MECPSYIYLKLENLEYLVISSVDLVHQNHEYSELFYSCIPEVYKFTEEEASEVGHFLKLDSKKKKLQNMIREKYGKIVPLDKLHNMKSKLTNSSDNDLQTVVELLQETYHADVHIYHEEETSTCKGIYFSTNEMRSDFQKWPEIVFLDGTYKLTNNDMTTMIFLVEDGNGRGQVVGVGLLATEERNVLEWMINAFKKDNEESCKNIKAFMTDKDLTERDVLKEIFPDVATYICIFHSLKTFKKVVNSSNMNLNSDEKLETLKVLESLVYASSEEQYNELYLELNLTASPEFMEYYNRNWHNIKEDWCLYSLMKHNLGNTTNNRLESINAKLKLVLEKNSPLIITIKDFFEWYNSHKTEAFIRTARQFLRRPNLQFPANSAEQKYVEALTKYSSKIVLAEIKSSVEIVCSRTDEISKICQFENLESSITTCQCKIKISHKLPCRHIFAVRRHFGLDLFDNCLYDPRWNKQKLIDQEVTLSSMSDNIKTDKAPFSVNVKTIKKKKVQTVSEKRKIVLAKATKLANIISLLCGSDYDRNVKLIDDIILHLSNNLIVDIVTGKDDKHLESSFQNLSIEENTNNDVIESTENTENTPNLRKIKTPAKIKIKGRPSGFLKTTRTLKKKA
ncbi:uncharacterized protein LOC123266707 [Cotesia glomerata]|uniref:uncharacterized protein LOC123266707 n=1 Tax=Cotesia glomerata TaxID=32391 RepID=UPI001D034ADB|nr:uncharacterized protein LOC123266707 [Cotesia glomerata]